MKKLPLLAIGAAALAVAGFGSAASAHDRDHVSFGLFIGGPRVVGPPPVVVERRYRDPYEDEYWAHRRWERHERWREHERWERERWERAHWHHWDD